MTKKQKQKLGRHLCSSAHEDMGMIVEVLDNIVGFYHKDPESVIMKMFEIKQMPDMKNADEVAFLDGAAVMFNSTTKKGYMDKAWAINSFFTEMSMQDCNRWNIWCDAISYQCNVESKATRYAKILKKYADTLEMTKERKGYYYGCAAMLLKFAQQMHDNWTVLNAEISEWYDNFHAWYISGGRINMLKSTAFWQVPRMDAFFNGKMFKQHDYLNPMFGVSGYSVRYKFQAKKEHKEYQAIGKALKKLNDEIKLCFPPKPER